MFYKRQQLFILYKSRCCKCYLIYKEVVFLKKYLYFFIFRLSNSLSVNTESLLKMSSGLFNIFLIETAADNYIYKVGSFVIEIEFQSNSLVPILEFKKFNLYNIIATKGTFLVFQFFGLFVEKFEERKSLFKLNGCLLQSINSCLVDILPKIFKVCTFLYISLTFGNSFQLLGLYVDINGKMLSLFFSFSLLSSSSTITRVFQFPFQ